MLRSCIVCAGRDSTPANFLLTCSACATSYHHRCHKPVLTDILLVALVKASTAIAKGSAPRDDKTPTLQNWKCAACTQYPRPPSQLALIDLTTGDSDEDKPTENHQVGIEVQVKPDQAQPQSEEDSKSALRERVKAEELPDSLPRRKYNLAPAWIHERHADFQIVDGWDRLAAKNRSRRPRKLEVVPVAKTSTRQSFICLAPHWLESRRSTLPI